MVPDLTEGQFNQRAELHEVPQLRSNDPQAKQAIYRTHDGMFGHRSASIARARSERTPTRFRTSSFGRFEV